MKVESVPSYVPSYGWQVAAGDAAAVTVGVASGEPLVFAVGFLISGPLVHVVHGRGGRAFGSLAMRFTLTGVGAITGAVISCMGDHDSAFFCDADDYIVPGALVGAATAAIVDWAFLSSARGPGEGAPSRRAWAPQVQPSRQGLTVGIAGAF